MTSHPEFNEDTEGLDVAKVFPDQIQGKTILITGVNKNGIGYATAEALASQSPTTIILASRTPSKVEECIGVLKERFPTVEYRFLHLDLSSQRSVRKGAAEVLSWNIPAIDVIFNSAAVMFLPDRILSEDGIEMHFATNHIGHFLLTNLLMPKLIKAAENKAPGTTRIVNVSSRSPQMAKMRWSDTNFNIINKNLPEIEQPAYEHQKKWGQVDPENKSYLPLEGYNQSKVANVLFSVASNKRLYEKYGILSFAVHPGVLTTELVRSMDQKTLDAIAQMGTSGYIAKRKTLGGGAATSLVAALDPKLGLPKTNAELDSENYGTYMIDCQISDTAQPLAVSSSEAERLWTMSEGLVKEKFEW